MNFSDALIQLKEGNRIKRSGWYKEFIILMYEEKPTELDTDIVIGGNEPYIRLWTIRNNWQYGWFPSTYDLLAEDWEIK